MVFRQNIIFHYLRIPLLALGLIRRAARVPLSVSALAILRPLAVICVQSSGEIQAIRQY
jgi:hypothetical protein